MAPKTAFPAGSTGPGAQVIAPNRRGWIATALLVVGALMLGGCADRGLRAAAQAESQHLDGRGPIMYVQGKDNNNLIVPLVDRWNASHPDEMVSFREQSDQSDQQHEDLVQHFQARDTGYDVVSVDIPWTAEFAARGWLQPLEGSLAVDTATMLTSAVNSTRYRGRPFAAPRSSTTGLLYYRTDLLTTPPATWDQLFTDCAVARNAGIDCYGAQFTKYEGLTVNAVEAINTFGGAIVGPDGVTPAVDSPAAKSAINMLVGAFANGNIPRQAITFQEEQGRQAFQSGKLLFLRNWPYAYSLMQKQGGSDVIGKFGVAPLPGIGNNPGRSTIGGNNLGINVYSKHKATARDFITFMLSEETQAFSMEQASMAPARSDVYDDPAIIAKYPYMPALKAGLATAVARPVTPFYPAVTRAVQSNIYAAIRGEKSVDDAVADIAAAINAAGS